MPAVAFATAPANDTFTSATQVTDLPVSLGYSLAEATLETGEPPSCSSSVGQTVWFDYTAQSDGLVVVNSGNYYGVITAFTGADLGSLTSVGCNSGAYWPLYLVVTAGTTYHFQVANGYISDTYGTFSLAVAPPPSVSVWVNPSDPSIYDQAFFNASVSDPANQPITSAVWDFGTGNGERAVGGDSKAPPTATTRSRSTRRRRMAGRRRTPRRFPCARTDVAITKFDVPTSATPVRPGRSRSASATGATRGTSRSALQEIPGGWGLVGTLTQFVQAQRCGSRRSPSPTRSRPPTRLSARSSFKAEAVIRGYVTAFPPTTSRSPCPRRSGSSGGSR